MIDDPTLQSIIDRILAATPARAVDAALGARGEMLAEVDAVRESVASLALALAPVAPSPAVRDRLAAALAALPDFTPKTAVVVVDMLNDHLTPGRPLEVARARGIVPAMRRRLAAARAAGEPVIYLCDHHEPGDPDLLNWPDHNLDDPRASVWPEVAPEADDLVLTHRHYSCFSETALDATLRAAGVNTVEITGCITEIHLYATAIDALQRGYRVRVPAALQAGSSEAVEQVILGTLSVLRPVEAHVTP
ncbi:MAG: Nicotinamidase [Myxococcaceae bacterium]|nr:Nicotinamidase [Myxococcaceae bacterium]